MNVSLCISVINLSFPRLHLYSVRILANIEGAPRNNYQKILHYAAKNTKEVAKRTATEGEVKFVRAIARPMMAR